MNRLGCGSKGPLNNFSVLKNHPFFEGINFDEIAFINPPGLNNLKEVMNSAKSIKMINSSEKQKNHQNEYYIKSENNNLSKEEKIIFDNSININLDNVIRVLKEGILKKKSPWFHYNTRKVIIDTTPKVEYIDPVSGIVKVKYIK